MPGIFNEETTVAVSKQNDSKVFNSKIEIEETNIGSLTDCDNFSLPVNINLYSNALLQLADPILSILLSIPRQKDPKDVSIFRLQLLDLLKDFKRRSITTDYHPSVIEKSTYILCAALDEAIAHTSWGEQGGWVNHSLLSSMFTQRNGGEIFFILIDKACQQPKLLIDFIELAYILLMLGFKGKFSDTEQNELYEIKNYLYTLIEQYKKEDKDLRLVNKVENANKSSKPFVGFRYKFLIYYILILLTVVVSVCQIKFFINNDNIGQYLSNESQQVDDHVKSLIDKTKVKELQIDRTINDESSNVDNSK